jgi:hypothetical protein
MLDALLRIPPQLWGVLLLAAAATVVAALFCLGHVWDSRPAAAPGPPLNDPGARPEAIVPGQYAWMEPGVVALYDMETEEGSDGVYGVLETSPEYHARGWVVRMDSGEYIPCCRIAMPRPQRVETAGVA